MVGDLDGGVGIVFLEGELKRVRTVVDVEGIDIGLEGGRGIEETGELRQERIVGRGDSKKESKGESGRDLGGVFLGEESGVDEGEDDKEEELEDEDEDRQIGDGEDEAVDF